MDNASSEGFVVILDGGREALAPQSQDRSRGDDILEIPPDRIASQLGGIKAALENQALLMDEKKEGLALDEIKVTLSISAEGKIGFLASGISASGSATIDVTFKRIA